MTTKNNQIPEMQEWVDRYGCSLEDKPPYAVFGTYSSNKGLIRGIIAVANNEFHAHILCREFNKKGSLKVVRTEYHQNSNFSIKDYRSKIQKRLKGKLQ